LLGFSIPISTAFDSILLALVAMLWIAGGDLRRKFATIAANPVALAALALFGMLIVGQFYGDRYPGDGLKYLGKYLDLLFIPIFITLFQDARIREIALRWFCAAMVLSFLVAELAAFGVLDGNPLLGRSAGHAFKLSITHGLLSAFAAFVFALLAHREKRWPQRLLFAVLALVAVKNVLLLGISRTAYLVLVVLALYLSFILFRKRGLVVAGLLLAATFAAVYGGSEAFRERVDTVFVDSGDWRSKWPSRESVTMRLEWYQRSLDIVLDHPLLGTGTGSYPRSYAETMKDESPVRHRNPHNEYLLIAVQTGIAGLLLLLHLFWQQLRLSGRLATPVETHLARGLVLTMMVGCLFNSLLLDHTEGLLFAWLSGVLFAGLKSPA
jgi:O-antigen ligase